MNRTLAAMLIGATVLLTACTGSPAPNAQASLVDQQTPIAEDDPGFNCFEHGNRWCGDPNGLHTQDAWDAWDAGEGWRRLRAASTDTRVVYVGYGIDAHSPDVNALNEVAVPNGVYWYVFRAEPAAPPMDTITAPATEGK